MVWRKRGRIQLNENQLGEWQKGYQMLPCPVLIGDYIRVYLGFCDKNNVGRIGYVDLNSDDPSEVIQISEYPLLDVGQKGCFDDNGIVPLSILRKDNEIWLYYVGFSLGVKVPYYMFGGLAISRDEGETFARLSAAPILDRTNCELYARCGMTVIYDHNKYKMWYIGSFNEGWTISGDKLRPLYTMKYTESDDGIHWNNISKQCMKFESGDEHGFGRAFVWRDNNVYKMYFSVRTYSRGYYISYAESANGVEWQRMNEKTGISCSDLGWDSINMSYPYLIKVKNKTYMFYNGNGCGKTGFGYAELQSRV